MKELWKILKTTQFIASGYFVNIPKNPRFRIQNRQKFNEHLQKIKGRDAQSQAWLTHLVNVNYYCDTSQVDLLEYELKELSDIYGPKTDSTVHSVLQAEKIVFEKYADKFDEDTLNYDLRKFRPSPCFLPDGQIQFEKKD
ncbi:MAG: hypothetical protein MI975_24765 [Cytophagales bacterium]|nr:hypothetical protein [Cytophagales bacterium]